MNSHSCAMAVPPTNRAGPIERAGLTDTPVTSMPTRWIAASVRPIARPAKPEAAPALVAPRITVTNTKVIENSNTNAADAEYSPR
ncbi:MAG: hypothetical protein ACD_54C00924G0001 [uncultured bacterium]|nr:MAG: hypothetical protein ACD_54C00924G0001 [uncultured bacterium]